MLYNPSPSHPTASCSQSAYTKTSLSLNHFLNANEEMSYEKGQGLILPGTMRQKQDYHVLRHGQ